MGNTKDSHEALLQKFKSLKDEYEQYNARLLELRAQYKAEKTQLDECVEQLKAEFNVKDINEARQLYKTLESQAENDIAQLESSVSQMRNILVGIN